MRLLTALQESDVSLLRLERLQLKHRDYLLQFHRGIIIVVVVGRN